ncbi:MAG: STAS domain-containing protein [Thiotrichales bacterium]
MSSSSARYAREGGIWILKLAGDLRHTLAPAVNALFDHAFADAEFGGCAIDMAEVTMIDSTCLGVLARVANHHQEAGLDKPTIIGANADVVTVLESVCFEQLFHLEPSRVEPAAEFEQVPSVEVSKDDARALVLEAHRRLCAIDARTHDAFKDLVAALEMAQSPRAGH